MGFSRHECWSGLPCPPPEDLPNPEIKPRSPTLQVDFLPSEPPSRIITHRKNLEKHALYLMSALFPTPQHTRSHCPSMQADCLLPSRWVILKGTDMSFPDGMLRAGYRYLHNYGEVGESSQITRKNTFRYLKHRYCKYIVSFFITISLVFAMFW